MLTLIYFILILGLIVLVHEFGHFIFSKLFGVHVYEFSIGMGPRLFGTKKKKGKTQYNVRALPIGGFVALAGEDPTEKDPEVPEGTYLYQKPVWQRAIIMCAGVFNNFLLGFILLFFVGLFHGSVDLTPRVINLTEGSPMYLEGIREGDIFKSINGHTVKTTDETRVILTLENDGSTTEFVVERDGKELTFNVKPVENVIVGELSKKDELYKLGFRTGDTVTLVNEEAVTSKKQFLELIEKQNELEEGTFQITVERINEDSNEEYFTIILDNNTKINKKMVEKASKYGIIFEKEYVEDNGFLPALNFAFEQFKSYFRQMFITFEYLFKGAVGLNDMSGPVGIYSIVGEATKTSVLLNLATLTALLCVNVGFINILPFPAFDGGRLLFLIIEKIKGSPVNPKIENTVNSVGFMLLMLLVIVITISDISKLIG